jgi:rubrerythrin
MLSKNPVVSDQVQGEDYDKEVLRISIISELDAINLYEQFSIQAMNPDLVKIFQDIIKEEKTHIGEFAAMLQKLDGEQEKELESGKKEIEEILSGEEKENDE